MPPESPPIGTPYSVIMPAGVDLPTPPCFVYQTLPSGPPVIAMGPMFVTVVLKRPKLVPSVARLPMALGEVLWCVNQILPSGPAAMAPGSLGVGMSNSVIVMSGPLIGIAGGPPLAPVIPPVPVVAPPVPPVVALEVVAAAPPLPTEVVLPLLALVLLVPLLAAPPAPVTVDAAFPVFVEEQPREPTKKISAGRTLRVTREAPEAWR